MQGRRTRVLYNIMAKIPMNYLLCMKEDPYEAVKNHRITVPSDYYYLHGQRFCCGGAKACHESQQLCVKDHHQLQQLRYGIRVRLCGSVR